MFNKNSYAALLGMAMMFEALDAPPNHPDYGDQKRMRKILANTPGDMKPFSGKRKYKKPVGCNKPKKNRRAMEHPYIGVKKKVKEA